MFSLLKVLAVDLNFFSIIIYVNCFYINFVYISVSIVQKITNQLEMNHFLIVHCIFHTIDLDIKL
jgi:hypothetical protein